MHFHESKFWLVWVSIFLISCSQDGNKNKNQDSGGLPKDGKALDTSIASDGPAGDSHNNDNPRPISCEEGESPLSSALILKTAHFQFQACLFQGAGHTTGFRLMSLTVKDTSSLLPEEIRGKELIVANDKIVKYKYPDPRTLPEGKQLIYDQNHHNACESFYLHFSDHDLSYAVSTPPLAGCGPVLENAPERASDDDPLGSNDTFDLLYRIKYPQKPWGETQELKGTRHYLKIMN